jgi:hypothetical protein
MNGFRPVNGQISFALAAPCLCVYLLVIAMRLEYQSATLMDAMKANWIEAFYLVSCAECRPQS